MTVLTTSAADLDALARSLTKAPQLVIVSLCAAWCDTCNEFRAAFERIASARPQCVFVWLDIEDDATLTSDFDVENFPTLAVFREGRPAYFGVSLPHESTVLRLIDALLQSADRVVDAPAAVEALPTALSKAAAG